MRGSRRIGRYVFRELTPPTLLALLLYTFVLLMNHFFLVAEQALSKNLDGGLTLRLFLMAVPNLLILAIPMSVILGCLIGVGRLSADQEWIALQSAGQGPMRLLRPMATFGLLASLLSLAIYAEVAPRASYGLRNLRGEILFASNLAADLKPRVFYTQLPNVVLFVDDIRADSQGKLEGVLLVQAVPDNETTEIYLARQGDLYPAPDGTGALILDLTDGTAHHFRSNDPRVYRVSTFEFVRRRFDPAAFLKAFLEPPEKIIQDLSPAELWAEYRNAVEEQQRAVASGQTDKERFIVDSRASRATIELHQRLALPLASFAFAILALPLGITRVRSGKGAGFAVSLFVILLYWTVFTLARDQALRGRIPAALGPWLANLLIVPWAAFGLWRLRRPPSASGGWIYRLFAAIVRGVRRIAARLTFSRRRRPGEAPRLEDEGADLADLAGTTSRFVGRLDQYIGMQYLRTLLLAVLSAYLVYGLIEAKTLVDYLLRNRLPFSMLGGYFKYFVPGVLHLVLPISCLVAAVVTFTLLSRTGELTAIKAVGISMRRATVSVLVLTVALSGLLFLVQDRIAPVANRKAQEVKDRILGRAPRSYGTPASGRWAFGPEGRRLYHYRVYDAKREEFQGLSVFTLDRSTPRILDHRFAAQARWRGETWELEGGWYRDFPDEERPRIFEQNGGLERVGLDPPANFASRQLRLTSSVGNVPDQMSLAEIQEQIDTLEDSGYDTTRLRVAHAGKIAHASAPLVMVILGLPFAFRVGRRGSLYGIGVALVLVLVYWATFAIFNALGMETLLPPAAAAWAPNVLFGLLGVYLLLYIRT